MNMFFVNYWFYILLTFIMLCLFCLLIVFIVDKYKFSKSLGRYIVLVELERRLREWYKVERILSSKYSRLNDKYRKFRILCTMETLMYNPISSKHFLCNLSKEEIRDLSVLLKEARLVKGKPLNNHKNIQKLYSEYMMNAEILVNFR